MRVVYFYPDSVTSGVEETAFDPVQCVLSLRSIEPRSGPAASDGRSVVRPTSENNTKTTTCTGHACSRPRGISRVIKKQIINYQGFHHCANKDMMSSNRKNLLTLRSVWTLLTLVCHFPSHIPSSYISLEWNTLLYMHRDRITAP